MLIEKQRNGERKRQETDKDNKKDGKRPRRKRREFIYIMNKCLMYFSTNLKINIKRQKILLPVPKVDLLGSRASGGIYCSVLSPSKNGERCGGSVTPIKYFSTGIN